MCVKKDVNFEKVVEVFEKFKCGEKFIFDEFLFL